jgi:hypothetical protein
MTGTNGTSDQARAAAILRQLPLTAEQTAAVDRFGTHGLYYPDQDILRTLAYELKPADRWTVEKAIRSAHYHPVAEPPRKPDPKAEKAMAAVYAELATATLEQQRAKDGWLIELARARKAQTTEQVEARQVVVRDAEENYRSATERVERLLGRLSDLRQRQADLQRNALLAETTK